MSELPDQVKTPGARADSVERVSDDLSQWVQQHRWDIGARIRDLRRARDLSQMQLADRADLDNKTISRLENGVFDARLSYYLRVAQALGVPPDRLFRDE